MVSSRVKQKSLRDLKRRKSHRSPLDRVLIVCEGTKTEPLYFNEIRQKFRLPTTTIKAIGSPLGTSPLKVIESAVSEFERTREWERIYAVFDRDEHEEFAQALQKAKALDGHFRNDLKQRVMFRAIPSNPCFEVWFLLHYQPIGRKMHRNEVIAALKKRMPHYSKGESGMLSKTLALLETAYRNTAVLNLDATKNRLGGDYAMTHVNELVGLLMNMRAGQM